LLTALSLTKGIRESVANAQALPVISSGNGPVQ
jgi:hypothetical protein